MGVVANLIVLPVLAAAINNRPVVGILSVPIAKSYGCITVLGGEEGARAGSASCFHSLYVKWVESAGAQVVPIRYDSSADELARLFKSVNAVLFTGGEVDVKHTADAQSKKYLETATSLCNMVLAANDAGDHVPLWGSCMGIQTLAIIGAGGNGTVLTSGVFDSEGESLPLTLRPAAKTSQPARQSSSGR